MPWLETSLARSTGKMRLGCVQRRKHHASHLVVPAEEPVGNGRHLTAGVTWYRRQEEADAQEQGRSILGERYREQCE